MLQPMVKSTIADGAEETPQRPEQGAESGETGAGSREQGHRLDNYRNKEVASPRDRQKRPLRVL